MDTKGDTRISRMLITWLRSSDMEQVIQSKASMRSCGIEPVHMIGQTYLLGDLSRFIDAAIDRMVLVSCNRYRKSSNDYCNYPFL